MIEAHREGMSSTALLLLIQQELNEEEASLILDIIALESKKNHESY